MAESTKDFITKQERWWWHWRHCAAYIFMLICIFDFIVMPIIYEYNGKVDPIKAVELSLQYKAAETQNIALQTLLSKRAWEPLTLRANGMFFVAFGAILGIAAFGRSKEKELKADMFGNVDYSEAQLRAAKSRNIDNPDK